MLGRTHKIYGNEEGSTIALWQDVICTTSSILLLWFVWHIWRIFETCIFASLARKQHDWRRSRAVRSATEWCSEDFDAVALAQSTAFYAEIRNASNTWWWSQLITARAPASVACPSTTRNSSCWRSVAVKSFQYRGLGDDLGLLHWETLDASRQTISTPSSVWDFFFGGFGPLIQNLVRDPFEKYACQIGSFPHGSEWTQQVFEVSPPRNRFTDSWPPSQARVIYVIWDLPSSSYHYGNLKGSPECPQCHQPPGNCRRPDHPGLPKKKIPETSGGEMRDPDFQIQLKTPLDTSKLIQVATKMTSRIPIRTHGSQTLWVRFLAFNLEKTI